MLKIKGVPPNVSAQHRPTGLRLLRAGLMALVCGFCAMTLPAQAQWQDADLTAITGGPNAASSSIAMAFDPVSNGMRTHYRSAGNNHVHELFLYGTQWQDADLTAITGGPATSRNAIAIAFDPIWNGMRTHYISGADGHVHELFESGGYWQDADLTAIAGGPPANPGALAMAFDPIWNGMRTHYVAATNFHVHELFLWGSQWQDADLTAITGGPTANSEAIAMAFDPVSNGMRTHYFSNGNSHVHELFLWGSQWQDADLTAITGGPTANARAIAIAFDPVYNGMHTHYFSSGNLHVHELFVSSGQWGDADLTALAGGPNADGYAIAIAFDPASWTMRSHYVSNFTDHVHELALSGGQWRDADLTALTGGPTADRYIAIAYDPAWGSVRAHYIGLPPLTGSHMHELFLNR